MSLHELDKPASPPETALKSPVPGDVTTYPFSPSAAEHARLEGQHAALIDLMGCVIHAHVPPNPDLLVDLGCGTGCVTAYLGANYPTATAIGVDRSPVPPLQRQLANVHFIQGDIQRLSPELDPRLAPGTTDLAFGRLLALGIIEWPTFISSAASLVKPGTGSVEFQELLWRVFDSDGVRIDESMDWMRELRAGMVRKGLDPDAALNMQQRMEDARLEDVQSWTYKWTVGPWLAEGEPKTRKMGEFNGVEMVGPISGLLEGMADTEGRAVRLQKEMREDLRAREPGERGGVYFEFKVTLGRRREDD